MVESGTSREVYAHGVLCVYVSEVPLRFVGTCFLNCRQPQSEGIDQLCTILQEVSIPEFSATHTRYSQILS